MTETLDSRRRQRHGPPEHYEPRYGPKGVLVGYKVHTSSSEAYDLWPAMMDAPKNLYPRTHAFRAAMDTPGHLPTQAEARKLLPLATGCIDYFPDALAAVAGLSRIGGEQHNPGKPLFWDRSKSGDESDALMRHFLERGTIDTDGVRHSAKVAWRALALLQKEIEAERQAGGNVPSDVPSPWRDGDVWWGPEGTSTPVPPGGHVWMRKPGVNTWQLRKIFG